MSIINVSIGVDESFFMRMKEKLGKETDLGVLIDCIEYMNWILEKIEEGMIIVAIDEKTGEPIDRFVTEGVKYFRNNLI
jgi:hypothetical protein